MVASAWDRGMVSGRGVSVSELGLEVLVSGMEMGVLVLGMVMDLEVLVSEMDWERCSFRWQVVPDPEIQA